MMQTAKDIYQAYLDTVSCALLDRDFDTVIAHYHLPHEMTSRTSSAIFHDPEALRPALLGLRESFDRLRVNALMRLCTEAEFLPGAKDRIVGRHTSYALRGAIHAVPPYESRMELIRGPDRWQSSYIHSDIGDSHVTLVSPTHGHAMGAAADTPSDRAVPAPADMQCKEPSK
jgi:hypothetical protein